MERIKKHPTGNVYSLTEEEIWVRNFALPVNPLDINQLFQKSDYSLFLENEIANEQKDLATFDSTLKFEKAVIISDGYQFKEKQKLLETLPANVIVIATNRTLAKWQIKRKIDFFLVNNPYPECMGQIPSHRYLPKCIVSARTYPLFTEEYQKKGGIVFSYSPTPEKQYSSHIKNKFQLDDYRNPICAAVHLAFKLEVNQLLLMCCDDSFKEERPAAVQLKNGLWTYPHHLISSHIIGNMLSWYRKSRKSSFGNCSSGLVYKDVPYISEEEVKKFFE